MSMRKLVIGSSNIYRFHEHLDKEDQESTEVQKCTRMIQFEALMEALDESKPLVVVSVIENFVCEAVGETTVKEEIESIATGVLNKFVEIVEITAKRLPHTNFAIVEPMSRPAVTWYSQGEEGFRSVYSNMIKGRNLKNVGLITMEDLPSQIFDKMGVHLTVMAGRMFVEAVIYFSNCFFKERLNVENPEIMEVTPGGSGSGNLIPLLTNPIVEVRERTIVEQLADIRDVMEDRMANDNRILARIREELDFTANQKKEDRIVISGMTVGRIQRPAGRVEFLAWIRGIVCETIEKIVEGSGSGVQFVAPGRSFGLEIPMCEVKMKDKEIAQKIRREFGKLRKEGKLTGRLFISNSVTLATRVRLEILRAVAKKCSNKNEDMYCMGFTSRPVLQVKRKDGSGQSALTFVDAISKYGNKVREADLTLAYERAGLTFRGQMAQNFVVMTDKGVKVGARGMRGGAGAGPLVLSGANEKTLGNKRPLEPTTQSNESSKRPSV